VQQVSAPCIQYHIRLWRLSRRMRWCTAAYCSRSLTRDLLFDHLNESIVLHRPSCQQQSNFDQSYWYFSKCVSSQVIGGGVNPIEFVVLSSDLLMLHRIARTFLNVLTDFSIRCSCCRMGTRIIYWRCLQHLSFTIWNCGLCFRTHSCWT